MTRADYDVSTASDREQALAMAREGMPDLILLLPKMTGPDVLKALKSDARTKAIPVVVLSGLSQKNAARLQGDGALLYLEKSALGLDKGTDILLSSLAGIVRKLTEKQGKKNASDG